MAETISADYLVIGAGATGMAFVDTMLSDSNATVVIVDRYARPGGHWTLAYPYVRLPQPSAFYGVNSRRLGEDKVDQVGWNKGLMELATVDEVCAYYNIVMHETFLPSGRVTYYPKHEYIAEGQWRSVLTGKHFRVDKKTTIVNTTYVKVKVPSMGPPSYAVSAEVTLITPNDLPKTTRPHGAYTVIGAGKTGIDACLWLLAQSIDPEKITWIMPRDPWFIERSTVQPGPQFAKKTAASLAATNRAIMEATSPEDLLLRLEASKQLLRMTDKIRPIMYHGATITHLELEAVKQISTIVRQGRVVRIEAAEVTMEQGTYTPVADTLYIDCSASAIPKVKPVPVFKHKRITLQPVRQFQPVFSAAFIAHVEATYNENKLKNELCQVIPFPDEPADWVPMALQNLRNALAWAAQPKTVAWLAQSRLDFNGAFSRGQSNNSEQAVEFHAALEAKVRPICDKLEWLLSQLPTKTEVSKPKLARL